MKLKFYLILIFCISQISAQNFSVTDVRVVQRNDTSFTVDIFYNLSLVTNTATITMQASSDNGNTWSLSCNNITGAVGTGITAGTNKQIIWNFGAEHTNFYNEQVKVKIIADDGITPCPGTPTVTYFGKTYNTVQIGSQCWLRENLDVGTRINGSQEQTNNSTIEKYCYNDLESSCNTYGGLYQWNEAMQYVTTPGTQGICPTGWHIPTLAEFETLKNVVGNNSNALKAVGQGTAAGAGTNTSGFSAMLAGFRGGSGYFYDLDNYAYFWSSSEYDASSAHRLTLYYDNSGIYFYYFAKYVGFSVRCIQDAMIQINSPNGGENWQVGSSQNITWTSSNVSNVKLDYTTNNGTNWLNITNSVSASTGSYAWTVPNTPSTQCKVRITDASNSAIGDTSNKFFAIGSVPINPCPGTPTVTYAGKTYNTVLIGNQCWLRENLDIGTMITGTQDQTNNSIIEKYCHNNDTVYCKIYGGLYQWRETMQYSTTPGTKGICPEGWHIPTDTELQTLVNASIVNNNGNALKEIGQGTGTGAGTNTSGFSAILAGNRDYNGDLGALGQEAKYWSSMEFDDNITYAIKLSINNASINFNSYYKNNGFSVRCIKN